MQKWKNSKIFPFFNYEISLKPNWQIQTIINARQALACPELGTAQPQVKLRQVSLKQFKLRQVILGQVNLGHLKLGQMKLG